MNHEQSPKKLADGSLTYSELTTVLERISTECEECGEGMTLVCLEPRCNCVFCERCGLVNHRCHRINELQLLLMCEREVALSKVSSVSQRELIDKYVLPYLRPRAELIELRYYERLSKRLGWLEALMRTTVKAVGLLRGNPNEPLLECKDGFRRELSHISFQLEKPWKVDSFNKMQKEWGLQLPTLDS